MKLYTNLDIVNGLSTCRDMFEAKAYLKANNIDISDQELELLQSQCNKINSERTLTEELLNKVAGGMYGVEAHRQEAPQYGGEMFGDRRTHRQAAPQYSYELHRDLFDSMFPDKDEKYKRNAARFIAGICESREYREECSMSTIVKYLLGRSSGRSWHTDGSGVKLTPELALSIAESFDANYRTRQEQEQFLLAQIADLNAEVEHYKALSAKFNDPVRESGLDGDVPGTPPEIPCTPPDSP